MGASDIISILQTNGSVIGAVSLLLSISAILFTIYSSRRTLTNQNSWQTYQMYNSNQIRQGRLVARALKDMPGWQQVYDLGAYVALFRLNDPEGSERNDPVKKLHEEDQALHFLLNYYHQVGMLLQRNQLDRDFTMELIGEGLSDRWEQISRIPTFYGDTAYQGMFELYDAFHRWENGAGRRMRRKGLRARAVVPAESSQAALERRVPARSR